MGRSKQAATRAGTRAPTTSATAAVAIVVGLGVSLSGCGIVQSGSCIDWVSLPTSAERRAESSLVVDAEVRATDRTVDVGGRYRVYQAAVTSTSKGNAPGRSIDVISTSDQCTTSGQPVEYLEGDVLSDGGSFRLYLRKQQGHDVWRLVVPGAAERRP